MQKYADAKWRVYAEQGMEQDLSVEERMRLRRAYYAGMVDFLEGLMDNMGSQIGDYLEGMTVELLEFRQGVLERKN